MIIDRTKKRSVREAYGKALVDLGKNNKDIVVLDADLSCSTQTKLFAKEFPDRFFNLGIAEQNLIGTAAGLSVAGKIPFASSFAVFATGRTYDQIRNSVCYPKFNVKIVGTHGGVTVGEDGASHQALEDISLMRGIPNMTVVVPADYAETYSAIKYASEHDGPFYIRVARTTLPDIFEEGNIEDICVAVSTYVERSSDMTVPILITVAVFFGVIIVIVSIVFLVLYMHRTKKRRMEEQIIAKRAGQIYGNEQYAGPRRMETGQMNGYGQSDSVTRYTGEDNTGGLR